MTQNACSGLFSRLIFTLWLLKFCSGVPLNKFITNFEPVYYNKEDLTAKHYAVKRSPKKILQLQFSAFDRLFELQLHQDKGIFTPDAIIESGTGIPIDYDKSRIYVGSLEGRFNTTVHGVITEEGVFDGKITTPQDEYIVEPAARYFQTEALNGDKKNVDFQSIIYRISDVAFPDNLPMRCGYKYGPKLSMNKYVNIHRSKRYDTTKTCCGMFLQGDHTFSQNHGSVITAIEDIILHVQSLNIMYQTVDFNDDGVADNITFAVQRLRMHTAESLDDPNYPLGDFVTDSAEYLDSFSAMEKYDDYCVSFIFTDRDFENGVLGLAWMGSPGSVVGGICQDQVFFGEMMSLNTGLVTLRDGGIPLPTAVTFLVLGHEVGHSFGSDHDPLSETCAPGEDDGGFYIMHTYAVDGTRPNNGRFSPCSITSMNDVIKADGISSDGCFIDHPIAICGNGIIEGHEECDCGLSEECRDNCCYSFDRNGLSDGTPCTLKPGALCSPQVNSCCNKQCTFYTRSDNILCIEDSACVEAAYCQDDGTCANAVFKPDGTTCSDNMICYEGECSHSICEFHGFERCQCSFETQLCHLCCMVDENCISSYDIDTMVDTKVQPGSPCNDFKGYCDNSIHCIEVEPRAQMPPVILKKESSLSSWLGIHWWAIMLIVLATMAVILVIGYKVSPRPMQVEPEDNNQNSSTYT
ncbi:disintegrin and metalloproteinase domain-containing protein 10-like [Ptychodera flava]|uniref:disintegrin and metalloproteinase domain-containing protein 10-like n=1 Tax=Ptychodera flava TaxID=63121 RepID=UPI00396A1D4B